MTFLTRRELIPASIAVPALTHQAFRQQATPASPSASPAPSGPAAVEELMKTAGIPGCIYAIQKPGEDPVVTALGVADRTTGAPMTTDMHVRIGSITKSFTATIVLQLITEGALSFDDTLAKRLPDASTIPNADAITLRQMLTMTSGIADYLEHPDFKQAFDFNPADDLTMEKFVSMVTEQKPMFAPGKGAMYSNSNYWLLGKIIESVTGATFAEAVQERVAAPLSLTNTLEPADRSIPEPASRGYTWRPTASAATPGASPAASPAASPVPPSEPRDVTEVNLSLPGAAGSLVSTVADMNRFITALNSGELVTPEMSAEQLSCTSDLQGMKYGMGVIELMGTRGHGGNIDGFASWACQDIETGTNYVAVVNADPAKDETPALLVILTMISGKTLPKKG